MLRLRIENCHMRAPRLVAIPTGGIDQKKRALCLNLLHGCHKPRQHCCRILAIEKFNQFRDHLVRGFFHQPVSASVDKHALDIGCDHLALLDQERTAGLFPDSTSNGIVSLVFANPAKSSASFGKARKTSIPAAMWPGWA